MPRTFLAVLTTGLVVIVVSACLTFPRKPTSAAHPSQFRYMHCPECRRESLFSPAVFDAPCPRCDRQLVGTAESVKPSGGGPSRHRRMVAIVMVETIGVLGVLVALSYRPASAAELEYYYTVCPTPKCHRRLRFRADRVNFEGQCPLCKNRFVYPALTE